MGISAIPPAPSIPSNTKSGSTLTTNDFYKLLAAEMQYQDPTSDSGSGSSNSGDYITELAILSATTAIQSMTNIENYALAGELQGGTVSYNDISTSASGKEQQSLETGQVEAADLTGDSPRFYIATTTSGVMTGKWVNLSDINLIYAPNLTNSPPASGNTSTT